MPQQGMSERDGAHLSRPLSSEAKPSQGRAAMACCGWLPSPKEKASPMRSRMALRSSHPAQGGAAGPHVLGRGWQVKCCVPMESQGPLRGTPCSRRLSMPGTEAKVLTTAGGRQPASRAPHPAEQQIPAQLLACPVLRALGCAPGRPSVQRSSRLKSCRQVMERCSAAPCAAKCMARCSPRSTAASRASSLASSCRGRGAARAQQTVHRLLMPLDWPATR